MEGNGESVRPGRLAGRDWHRQLVLGWRALLMEDSVLEPHPERIARALVWAASLFMVCVGLWELAMPVGAGHFAVVGSRGIIADNMLTWDIITPVRSYLNSQPRGSDVYAHHPWGSFWLVGLFRWLFGRHDFVPRLYPVLMNALLPAMLYALGRALWGVVPGALCALGWVVLPITLSFAQFPGFEVPVVFSCIWVSWATVEFRQTGLRRWGIVAVAGFLSTPHTDWTAALFAGSVLGLALALMTLAPPSVLKAAQLRSSLRFWALAATGVGLGLGFYVYQFRELGQFNDWLHSAEFRASGNTTPLATVLNARRYWLQVMFTQLGIAVMLLGSVAMVVQLALRRRFEDVLPLLMLAVSTLHYVHFKNGADIHIFWPQPYAAHFALSLGAIAASLLSGARLLATALRKPGIRTYSGYWVLGSCAVIALLILPDAIRALDYARNSGGRFNEHGRLIHQDLDKTAALRFFAPKVPKGMRLGMDTSMTPNWAQEFALEHPIVEVQLQKAGRGGDRFRTLDSRFAHQESLGRIAQESPVTLVGPFWLIDAHAAPAPVVAHRFVEREPTWLEWLFVQAHDPILRIEPDPLSTWEWRAHLQQEPNPLPNVQAKSLEQLRILHNQAITLGDTAGAERYREALKRGFGRAYNDALPNGVRLIGSRLVQGVLPKLELYFMAAGPISGSQTFEIWSVSRGRAPLSWVMADELPRSQSLRFVLPPALWKAGMIYVSVSEIRQRPGPEHFEGAWAASSTWSGTQRDPRSPIIALLDLP